MDTFLYGLLGLSLAANVASVISTMIANSKKRDDENQKTISSVYEELNRKINDLHNDINHRVCGLEDLLNQRITAEVKDVRETLEGVEEDICDRLCDVEYQVESIRDQSESEFCATSKKKRNG